MEQKPVNTFVSPEKALDGGGQSPTQELYSFVPDGADRDDVIDSFMNRQVELNDTVEQIDATPGFNLDANGLLDKTAEKTEANDALTAVTDSWQEFGGNEIIEAQAAVDALNFNSTAEDRVAAQNRLRDAKNAFYENYRSAITVETIVEAESADAMESTGTDEVDSEGDSFPNIKRPAVLRYEAAQKAEAERDLSTSEPIALPAPNKIDAASTQPEADSHSSEKDPRKNWHEMMSGEREAREQARSHRTLELGAVATSDLLNDSELVQDHRARRQGRRSLFSGLRARIAMFKADREFKKLQKTNAKEMKAFDKSTAKEHALQEADAAAELKSAARADKQESRQMAKKAAFEAKQTAKTERFNEREQARLNRRRKLGRAAARTSLLFGRA